MEPRSEEACQSSPASAPMPSLPDARKALAIYGTQQHFRTVTIQFLSPSEAERFDARARDSVRIAVERAVYEDVEMKVLS